MTEYLKPQDEPVTNLRILISPCRSGSTALTQSMSQAPLVTCYNQKIKEGLRYSGRPDHSIFYNPIDSQEMIVNKETIGHSTLADCQLEIFPSDELIELVRPIFLFRDPVETWNSWSKAQWGTLDFFKLSYQHAIDTFKYASSVSDKVSLVRYEEFGENPQAVFQRICIFWDIPFVQEMIQWKTTFGKDSAVILGDYARKNIHLGHFDELIDSDRFTVQKNKIIIPKTDIRVINSMFREQYEALS